MRNTMSSGTAMIRVRVRPIGKFTLELRRRDDSAPSLWVVAHDLVNVGHVAGHERRCVEAQARVHVRGPPRGDQSRSEEHTSELQSRLHLVCRLLLEKKKNAFGGRFGLPALSLL